MSEPHDAAEPSAVASADPAGAVGATLSVTVRWFAQLRERRGADEERLTVAVGTTVAGLYRELVPPGPAGVLPVMFAVDRSYVSGDTVLEDGVEVVFVPPLGGG